MVYQKRQQNKTNVKQACSSTITSVSWNLICRLLLNIWINFAHQWQCSGLSNWQLKIFWNVQVGVEDKINWNIRKKHVYPICESRLNSLVLYHITDITEVLMTHFNDNRAEVVIKNYRIRIIQCLFRILENLMWKYENRNDRSEIAAEYHITIYIEPSPNPVKANMSSGKHSYKNPSCRGYLHIDFMVTRILINPRIWEITKRQSTDLTFGSREHRICVDHLHDDVIKWKHFPRRWPCVRGIHRPRWIPHTKASDAALWCFFLSASE